MSDGSAAGPRPEPLPLPLPGGSQRRRRPPDWGLRVGGAIAIFVVLILLLCVCCNTAGPLLEKSATGVGDRFLAVFGPRIWPGTTHVYWVDGGRRLVIQGTKTSYAASRLTVDPLVVAWSPDTSTAVTAMGYRVVGVEQATPRVWLVRDHARTFAESVTGTGSIYVPAVDEARDFVDEPVRGLLLWDIREPVSSIATSEVPAWAPWKGPGDFTVTAEIDPSLGSSPCRLRFTSSHGASAVATPTGGAATFEPIGWSPTGRYFAAVILVLRTALDPEQTSAAGTDRTVSEQAQYSRSRAVVYDAATGREVTDCGLAAGLDGHTDVATLVQWDARSDDLYCLVEGVQDRYTSSDSQRGEPSIFDREIYVIGPSHRRTRGEYLLGLLKTEPEYVALPYDTVVRGADPFTLLGAADGSNYLVSHSSDATAAPSLTLWKMERSSISGQGFLPANMYRPRLSPNGTIAGFLTPDLAAPTTFPRVSVVLTSIDGPLRGKTVTVWTQPTDISGMPYGLP